MLSTLTYTVRVDASPNQSQKLSDTCAAYLNCCNMVSKVAWEHKTLSQKTLHHLVYRRLRDEYHVGAQMACSSMNRVKGDAQRKAQAQENRSERKPLDAGRESSSLKGTRQPTVQAHALCAGKP